MDLIQTDAAISPGNSGGAVVDDHGAVLGISVVYVPPQQGAVAVGFAIPASTATRVADELLQHGRARHAYLGLQPGELTPQIAAQLHVRATAWSCTRSGQTAPPPRPESARATW